MSTLGSILTRMDDPDEIAALIAEAGSLSLLARLNDAAASSGCAPTDVACDAVERFTQSADSEAWVKLMGRMQGEAQPAAACLSEMIEWALAPAGGVNRTAHSHEHPPLHRQPSPH